MIRSALLVASAILIAGSASADPAATVPAGLAVYGDGGLAIGGTVLFKGPVTGAALDAKQDLLWFESDGTLEVIDLRDAARTPVVIATKIPTTSFSIGGFSEAHFQDEYTGVNIHFDVDKKPSASAEDGLYAEVDEDGAARIKKQAKKIKIVGKKWIAAQQKRVPNAAPAARQDPPHVTLAKDILDNCESPDICGTTSWLGGSPYQTIAVSHSCGDACHVGCMLYDPAKKQFAAPLADGGWGALADTSGAGDCSFEVEPGNARYAGGSKVCTLGAKMTCSDLGGWNVLAWIPAKP